MDSDGIYVGDHAGVCAFFFFWVFGRMIGLGVYELWMEFEVKLRG